MMAFDAYKILDEREAGSVIDLIAPCMDDYLYVFDLQKDCYKISKHATERFLLPGDNFDDAAKAHHTFVYSEDQSRLDD